MPIRAVIFDMDGVLTDSEPLINAAAVALFRERGVAVAPEDFLPFVGAGEDRYIGGVAEKHGVTLDLPAAKHRTYEIYLELVPQRLQAFPGAVELVRRCRAAGLLTAVASSADQVKVHANLNQIGLPPAEWNTVVTGESVVHKKPAPDIFLAAAQKLGLQPAECVVIEDAVNGIAAAKAAGMRCVAVAQTFPAEQLTAADVVVPGIRDLTPSELSTRPEPVPPPILPPPLPPAPAPDRVWGPWASLALGVLVVFGWLLAQAIVYGIGMVAHAARGRPLSPSEIESSGLFIASATLGAAPVAVGICWLFAWLRRGLAPARYLGLILPSLRWTLGSVGLLALLIVGTDLLSTVLNRPIVPEVMVDAYKTAGFLPLFWAAMVVGAPVAEEFVFSRLCLRGIAPLPPGRHGHHSPDLPPLGRHSSAV